METFETPEMASGTSTSTELAYNPKRIHRENTDEDDSMTTGLTRPKKTGTSILAFQQPSRNEIKSWNLDRLHQYLRQQRFYGVQVDDEDLGILNEQKIAGDAFLDMTRGTLREFGMKYGPANAIMKHLEILKGGDLTLSDVLLLVPPAVIYDLLPSAMPLPPLKKPKTYTISEYFRTPHSVKAWVGFEDNVNSMPLSSNCRFAKEQLTFKQDIVVDDETSVRFALQSNILDIMKVVECRAGERFGTHKAVPIICGEPDRVFLFDGSEVSEVSQVSEDSEESEDSEDLEDFSDDLEDYEDPKDSVDPEASKDPENFEDSENSEISENSDVPKKVSRHPLLVIEVKTQNVLGVNDLVSQYNEDASVAAQGRSVEKSTIFPVKQIFGYLAHNKLRYGVLTTYDRTWFLKRNIGKLYVSSTITYDNMKPTLLQCFAYIMRRARKKHSNGTLPSSPQDSEPSDPEPEAEDDNDSDFHLTGDDSNGGDSSADEGGRSKGKERDEGGRSKGKERDEGGRSKGKERGGRSMITRRKGYRTKENSTHPKIQKLKLNDFQIRDVLGYGRSGKVFRAALKGDEVAVKICDLSRHPEYLKEMRTEIKVYDILKSLQGQCIPTLKVAGHDGMLFVLVTEIVGHPLQDVGTLSEMELKKIVDKLSLIHSYGIVHNDISSDNILIRRNNDEFKVSFIDFALSKESRRKSEFRKEMSQLKSLLGLSKPAIKDPADLRPRKRRNK